MDESREGDHDQAFRLCSVRSVRCSVLEERSLHQRTANLTTILCLCISPYARTARVYLTVSRSPSAQPPP